MDVFERCEFAGKIEEVSCEIVGGGSGWLVTEIYHDCDALVVMECEGWCPFLEVRGILLIDIEDVLVH